MRFFADWQPEQQAFLEAAGTQRFKKQPTLKAAHHGDGLASDTFAPARKPELFGRGALDAHLLHVDPEHAGDIRLHLVLMRVHLRAFAHHDAIDVYNLVTGLADFLAHLAQEFQAVRALERGVGIREVRADIAEARGPEQRIANCMQKHVGIAMAQQALLVRDIYTTDNALAAFHKLVNVKTDSRTINLVHDNSFFFLHER